ncbi:MAG: LysR family transcriptional regulator [Gammaproteobacteria bacterium]|jgi:predicted thioesterase|nr:LysR family transcriptional regulator [Gammaproteobacteria bacterium]
MKTTLNPGVTLSRRVEIDLDRTISFMGDECRVYATPSLVRDIEHACRDLILEHADPGEDSVGTSISLEHSAATLLDMWAKITVTVVVVDGRRVRFSVSGTDPLEPICKGEHERFVVDVAKTAERLKAKSAKVAAGAL